MLAEEVGALMSNDARQLVLSGWNGVIRVFDAQTGEPRWQGVPLVNGETVSLTAAGELLNASPGALPELVYSMEKSDGSLESLAHAEFQTRIKSQTAP